MTIGFGNPSTPAAFCARRRRLAFAAAALLTVGCGASQESQEHPAGSPHGFYVGRVEGSDAAVAVVRDGNLWAAYLCGGPSSLSTATAWFEGSIDRTTAEVSSVTDEKALRATIGSAEATGSVETTDGQVHFTAARVPEDSLSGLFQASDNGCRTGLIVPPPGEGDPQGVYCADQATVTEAKARVFEQVTPVRPITSLDRVVPVQVLTQATRLILYLSPVTLPLTAP